MYSCSLSTSSRCSRSIVFTCTAWYRREASCTQNPDTCRDRTRPSALIAVRRHDRVCHPWTHRVTNADHAEVVVAIDLQQVEGLPSATLHRQDVAQSLCTRGF